MSSAAAAKATAYANTAREKIQGVMSTIKAMTFDEDGSIKKAPVVTPWENMVRTMFGSCTSSMPTNTADNVISPNSSRSSKSRTCEPSEPLSPSREKEEFFYSQFLSNDHTRAERAVSTLRDQVEKQEPEQRMMPPAPKKVLPKQFPVSTPPRKQQTIHPILVQETAPPKVGGREITSNISFDDGISCISAHTLEEMARQVPDARKLQLTASDLTSEGFEAIESAPSSSIFSPSFSPERINENNCQLGTPIDLNRSKVSKARSSGTKSTRSTNGSFEHKWRQDEQVYWQDVVEDDDMGTPEKRREIMERRVKALKQKSRSRDMVRFMCYMMLMLFYDVDVLFYYICTARTMHLTLSFCSISTGISGTTAVPPTETNPNIFDLWFFLLW
jgi:hypothetical protein